MQVDFRRKWNRDGRDRAFANPSDLPRQIDISFEERNGAGTFASFRSASPLRVLVGVGPEIGRCSVGSHQRHAFKLGPLLRPGTGAQPTAPPSLPPRRDPSQVMM